MSASPPRWGWGQQQVVYRTMGEGPNTEVLSRLKSIEGHVRAVVRMAEEDAYCIDVIRQIQAVQGALDRVANIILDDHLNSCVLSAVRGGDAESTERVMEEIVEVFRARGGPRRAR